MGPILLLVGAALAVEAQPGLWLPGATAVGQADGRFGAGVVWNEGGGESVMLKGVVGVSRIVAINAEGFVGGSAGYPQIGTGVRVLVLEDRHFSLAPYGQFDFRDHHMDGYLGMAGNFQGDTVSLDMSLTVFGLHSDGGDGGFTMPPYALRWMEAGVTWHPAKGQELRLGAIGRDTFQVNLAYRWLGSWWYVEPDLLYWPGDLEARAHAGVRF